MYGCQKCTRIYGCSVPVYTGRTAENHCEQCFLYRPYIRALYTDYRYALPVHKARTYGPYVRAVCTGVKNAPVYTGRKYGPYIRVLGTHYPYRRTVQLKRIAVLYGPYTRALYTGDRYALPVNTGRIYGCQKYTRMYGPTYGPYMRAVHTARIFGPYLRVVRIGLYDLTVFQNGGCSPSCF